MITINLDKAKEIVHDKRRKQRDKEFAPLDVQVTIPEISDKVELQRVEIRERYKKIQKQIDEIPTIERLKTIYKKLENN